MTQRPGWAYLDSSAAVKLILDDPGAAALARFLADWNARISSELASIEVMRAVRRGSPGGASRAGAVLEDLTVHRIGADVVTLAAVVDPPTLGSLDAIHLATALILREAIGVFVSYDRRLLAAADAFGLPVAAPA